MNGVVISSETTTQLTSLRGVNGNGARRHWVNVGEDTFEMYPR